MILTVYFKGGGRQTFSDAVMTREDMAGYIKESLATSCMSIVSPTRSVVIPSHAVEYCTIDEEPTPTTERRTAGEGDK